MSRPHSVLYGYGDGTSADGASTTQTPTVSTFVTLVSRGGSPDGVLGGAFQGYDPAVTGALTIGLGNTAYDLPGHLQAASPLKHVLNGTAVKDPTVLLDLNFATPAQGADNGLKADIGIASTTAGFSSLTGPLSVALQGTALGAELQPLLNIGAVLLPGLGKGGGVPHGGSLNTTPFFSAGLGVGLGQTLTLLGQTTTTNEAGSLKISPGHGAPTAAAATDLASLTGDAATLLSDVQGGNLLGAAVEGAATIAAGTALASSIGPLLAQAASQHNPTLAAVHNPTMSLNLNLADGQSYGLGIGSPTQVTETLNVQITADKFGAYALGKLLAQYAPQLIADLGGSTSQTAVNIFDQLAQGVSTLTQDAAAGFAGTGGAGAVPSSAVGPDVGISATLVTKEAQDIVGGNVTNSQTFSLGLDTNAQGLYDLGTAAQPILVDLLVGLLETPGGQEALQIGGAILQQVDQKFGGASAAMLPHAFTHT